MSTAALAGKVIGALLVGGLGAIGGYNLVSTGCPLGSCSADKTGEAGAITTVAHADEPAPGACPLGCTMADKPAAPEPAAAITLASMDEQADEPASCCKTDGAECPDGAEACDGACEGEIGACCKQPAEGG